MTSKLARVLAAATFVLALLPAPSEAQQPITVSGRVTNEANQPMQNVTVSIPVAGVATYTNAEGRYMLSRFSFLSGEPDKNSLNVESVKRQDLDTS